MTTLREGKTYKSREGAVVGPLRFVEHEPSRVCGFNWTDREGLRYWREDGRFLSSHEHGLDLVDELAGEPSFDHPVDLAAKAAVEQPEWAQAVEAEAAEEKLTLAAGKFYRTRDGQKIGPYAQHPDLPDIMWVYGNHLSARYKNGKLGTGNENLPRDLVAEWVDEPASIPELMQELNEAETSDIKTTLADEAKRIVSGARRSAYGTPEANFERIAALWTGYAKAKGWNIEFAPGDVSPLMILMKMGRIVETPAHYDSWVDVIGYGLTGAEVNKVGQ